MNIKFEMFKRKFIGKLEDSLRKVVLFLFKPLFNHSEKTEDAKDERMKKYNQAMSDEELMQRLAKHIIKRMIRYNGKITTFACCESFGNYEDRNNDDFIVYKLKNLYQCKDIYLKRYWADAHLLSLKEAEVVERENQLLPILKNEFEKMGVTTYCDIDATWDEYWKRRTKYIHTLYINLP